MSNFFKRLAHNLDDLLMTYFAALISVSPLASIEVLLSPREAHLLLWTAAGNAVAAWS